MSVELVVTLGDLTIFVGWDFERSQSPMRSFGRSGNIEGRGKLQDTGSVTRFDPIGGRHWCHPMVVRVSREPSTGLEYRSYTESSPSLEDGSLGPFVTGG